MKLKGLVAGALALALSCSTVSAEEYIDVNAIAARIAAQEAMLSDLECKLSAEEGNADGPASGIVSLRKNATVTLGGLVTTGVHYGTAKVRSKFNENGALIDGKMHTLAKLKATDMAITDADLYAEIEVNDHFDAYLYMDLHGSENDPGYYGVAKEYWVRWKNICDSGFGIKIGRSTLAFGDDDNAVGYLDNFTAGGGDGAFSWFGFYDGIIPAHNGWKYEGVIQVSPYWEGLDGKLKLELNLFQNMWNWAEYGALNGSTNEENIWTRYQNGRGYTRSKNYGLGSASFRAQYSPIEDLTFTAGFLNFRDNEAPRLGGSRNNTAISLAFNYRPCFAKKVRVWGQWIHGWNVDNVDNLDSDVVNAGFSYDITDELSFFAQGDYLRSKNSDWGGYKNTAWAFYTGLTYSMPMGATLEAGWRHEKAKIRQDGIGTWIKGTSDIVYANVGFEF